MHSTTARWRRKGGRYIPGTPPVRVGRWTSSQGPYRSVEGRHLQLLRIWNPPSTFLLLAVVHSDCHGPGHAEDEPHVARRSGTRGCDSQHLQGRGGHRGRLYCVLHRSGNRWCSIRVEPSQLHLSASIRRVFGLHRMGHLGPHEDPCQCPCSVPDSRGKVQGMRRSLLLGLVLLLLGCPDTSSHWRIRNLSQYLHFFNWLGRRRSNVCVREGRYYAMHVSTRAFEYRATCLGMIVFSQFICSGFAQQCGVLCLVERKRGKRVSFMM